MQDFNKWNQTTWGQIRHPNGLVLRCSSVDQRGRAALAQSHPSLPLLIAILTGTQCWKWWQEANMSVNANTKSRMFSSSSSWKTHVAEHQYEYGKFFSVRCGSFHWSHCNKQVLYLHIHSQPDLIRIHFCTLVYTLKIIYI